MNKFIFANQLRGIAAMLVVMTHYFGTFFAEQPLLAQKTFSPDLHLTMPRWAHWFELPYQGPFGVALFFLISGFVIPFSLKKLTLPGFLVNRLLRIFPTYACCLALGTAALYLSARYWGHSFDYDARVWVANALLVHNVLGLPSMDAVNWTLAIECKFYLLAALCSAAFFRRHPGWLLAALAAALALTWRWAHGTPMNPVWTTLVMELSFILFMLTGSLFHQHVTGLISTTALVARVALVVAAFSWAWSMGPQQGQFPSVTLWYLCAVLVFGLCYALRARFRPVRVLDFFAAISYPLYCVHALFGYCALKLLIGQGCAYGVAMLITLPCTIALAYAVHRTVENGSNKLGRRWGEALGARKAVAAAP